MKARQVKGLRTVLPLLVICALCLGWGAKQLAARSTQVRPDVICAEASTPAEKIALAKRLLQVPVDAPEGVLWKTYMARLYCVSFDATRDQMIIGQAERDERYNMRYEGFPDWCPYCPSLKGNFKSNIEGPLIGRWLSGCSLSASKQEYETASAEQLVRAKEECKRAGKEFEYDEFHRTCMVKALGLPKDTSLDEAYNALNRLSLFPDIRGQKEQAEIKRQREREEALAVLKYPADSPDTVLFDRMRIVTEGIKLESPDKELTFKLFY